MIEVIATKVWITPADTPEMYHVYLDTCLTNLEYKAGVGRVLWDTLQIQTEVDVMDMSTYSEFIEKREKSMICRVEVETNND